VLVDRGSPFARDDSTVPLRVVDLAGANGLVHDVQKLSMAVLECAINQQPEGDTSGNTGRD
jgi:hypothetical protein